MSSTVQKRAKNRGRGRPSLSGNVAIEAVRSEQLDIGKLAQAVGQYMRYMAEFSGSTKSTQSSSTAITSIAPVLDDTKQTPQKA